MCPSRCPVANANDTHRPGMLQFGKSVCIVCLSRRRSGVRKSGHSNINTDVCQVLSRTQSLSGLSGCPAWCWCSGEDNHLSTRRQGLSQLITMPPLSVLPNSKPSCSSIWLLCFLLGLSAIHAHANDDLPIPQQVSLTAKKDTQQLFISWLGGAATTFDLLILRTELNETVFYETVSVTVNQESGQHQWNWTSKEPLECTSLSIKIRSRAGQATSEWSDTQILQGSDLPTNEEIQMFPQDRVVPVGASTTFCCIIQEGKRFGAIIGPGNKEMNTTRLSRRTYAFTDFLQTPSFPSGSNIVCYDSPRTYLGGTVVFVGYPPLPTDFVCETRDLTSAVCQWKEGRDTSLSGKRRTYYSVNKSPQQTKLEILTQWDGKWTLEAVNPLGQYTLTDSAEIRHRVRAVAPDNLTSVAHVWNATISWQWEYNSYSSLPFVCQVEITSHDYKTERNFTGVGLRSVVLSNLVPDEDYSVRVRCGAQQNFWKWGDWSKICSFRTRTTVPDAPDAWVWMNRDNTGQVIWKPLTRGQSHGQITGYEVTFSSPQEKPKHMEVSPAHTTASFNLTQITAFGGDKVTVTVLAKNSDGVSQPASVLIPTSLKEAETRAVSKAFYSDRGFPLSWESDANATSGYVVEWYDASCMWDCRVEWLKVAAGSTNISIESADFQQGVMYNFSLYSCSSEQPPELQQGWHGYMQELVPSSPVPLTIRQHDSNIVLSWEEIPLVNRRGFILGYNIYKNNDSQLTLIANLSDVGIRTYTVKGFSGGTYKFTVKAYNSAGEDTGATLSITLPTNDWLILEILVSMGITSLFLVIVTFICYKKRKWVKKAFYPDIPEPKLPGDWPRAQGPLDVKPSPHSMVHVVEKPEWDSSKEMLVVIPEEDEDEEEQGIGDEPVDTDEPTSLRYYNQVVDERPIRPRYPDSSASSASSLDSARTDVTYTGIQTSGSSLVWPVDAQGSSEGNGRQADMSVGLGGGYRPQMQAKAQSENMCLVSPDPSPEPQAASFGGYKPQGASWHFDSPVEAGESTGLAPCLGSPTSVASTQFLLPDGEEHAEERRQPSSSAATWFTNLLSSTKP